MEILNGKHRIRFSKGKLYLDDNQIAGEGILPEKDVIFEFNINRPEEPKINPIISKDSSILEVNVNDSVRGKDVGPGQ